MSPADHVELAEQQLAMAAENGESWDTEMQTAWALKAIGHALIAIAVELGAPHQTLPAGAGNVSQ